MQAIIKDTNILESNHWGNLYTPRAHTEALMQSVPVQAHCPSFVSFLLIYLL